MDQKDEFNKWMKSVEEALSEESVVDEDILEQGSCGCGAWNCPDCFPDDNNDLGGLEGQQIPAIIVIPQQGGQQAPQQAPQGQSAPQPQGVGMAGTHPVDGDTFDHDEGDEIDVTMMGPDAFGEDGGEYGEPEAVDNTPRSGKGVKLGHIVQKFVKADAEGQNAPLTHGGELEEDEYSDEFGAEYGNDDVPYDDAAPIAKQNYHDEMSQIDPDEAMEIIGKIKYMQDMGLSKSNRAYSEEQLAQLPAVKLKQVQQEVMGGTGEAGGQQPAQAAPAPDQTGGGAEPEMDEAVGDQPPKKTRIKPQDMDFGDDIFGSQQDQPIANYSNPDDGEFNDTMDAPATPSMPRASAASTRAKTSAMSPSDQMRDMMNRISPDAGGDEPELAQQDQEGALVARTAQDVPKVISSAMQATGEQVPEWHTVNNLPGYQQQNVRGMGRQIFGMFTRTPLEQIQTIANVDGQGPNTDAEMRSVANWLMQNADDLGSVELSHGRAIPGYKPDVKEYSLNGVRFHVVRDPMGQYIYAYPDADATTNHNTAKIGQGDNQMPRGNTPRLRESTSYSLFEELAWDEKIRASIKSLLESEVEEARKPRTVDKKPGSPHLPGVKARDDRGSSLSRVIGKMQGGKNLIDALHKTHKLSNEAELDPVKVNGGGKASELAWAQFKQNSDDFVIISGEGGVAAVKPNRESLNDYVAKAQKDGREPNFSKDAGKIKYHVLAFTDDGNRISAELLRNPKSKDDLHPEIMKARMGKVHGRDTLNPDNIFNLLNNQIGPITTVWIAGWEGNRGEDNSELPPSRGAVDRTKIDTRAQMKAGKPAPKVSREGGVSKVFNRMKPVLKHVVDKAAGRVSSRLDRAAAGRNYEEMKKLADVEQKVKGFQDALNTSKDVQLSPDLAQMFTKALVKASGAHNEYEPEFLEYLNDLVAPGPSIGGKQVSNANSTKLYAVADALGRAFMGALA